MTNISIAVLSAAEFETARLLISDLSAHPSYDDWVDRRYGVFMGHSLGGDGARLVTVSLGPFLEWCDDRGVRPSESSLDAFAETSDDNPLQAVVESCAPNRLRPAPTGRNPRSISRSLGPKSALRSLGSDL